MWVKRATDDMTTEVIRNIKGYYESQSSGKDLATIEKTENYIQEHLTNVDWILTRNSMISGPP